MRGTCPILDSLLLILLDLKLCPKYRFRSKLFGQVFGRKVSPHSQLLELKLSELRSRGNLAREFFLEFPRSQENAEILKKLTD